MGSTEVVQSAGLRQSDDAAPEKAAMNADEARLAEMGK